MKQNRYYAEHHDSGSDKPLEPPPGGNSDTSLPGPGTSGPTSRFTRRLGLPDFVEPGVQAGDLANLRFLAPRKLRRIDIEGPSPLTLRINGRAVAVVQPGENSFDPPLPLASGDSLELEAVDPADTTGVLSGWNPAPALNDEHDAQGGRHV